MFGSCVVNIFLTIFFIKLFGLIGVAIATAISSLLWIYLTINVSENLYKTGINKRSFLTDKFILIISLIIMTFIFEQVDSKLFQYASLLLTLLLFSFLTWKLKKDIIIKLRNDIKQEII
tara:strand:+ start:170 stop:526 length:357 start_codon:yes stop_codon:yes gene_type:complete